MACEAMAEIVVTAIITGFERDAIFLVGFENLLKLRGCRAVKDKAINLVIK